MSGPLKDVIICDLDGTIADDSHRAGHLHGRDEATGGLVRDWDTYFSLCGADKPIGAVTNILWAMRNSYSIYILSGRSAKYIQTTKEWLDRHLVPYDFLQLRPENNRVQDDVLKLGWANDLDLKNRTLFVLEDRQRVVDAWRAAGYTCLQVAPGAF